MASSVKDIVENAMPGWQLQKDSKAALDAVKADAAPPDQVGKSDAELKRKYLSKTRGAAAAAAKAGSTAKPQSGNLKFARVIEKQAKDAVVGAKTVLVDTVSGKVKAAQG